MRNRDTVSIKGVQNRLFFIDNIRWMVIVLVVLIHLVVTYGNIGRWYYIEKKQLDVFSGIFFTAFGTFFQAFSMGLLFFIAGYFVPGSYDRKGARKFINERMVRLGLPTLFYMLILHPVVELIKGAFGGEAIPQPLRAYLVYAGGFHFLKESGPLWFALALLIFTLVYVLLRVLSRSREVRIKKPLPVTHGGVAFLILMMAVITFVVRMFQPIGTAVYNMQLCFFPQYIILFIVGILASRGNLLLNLPSGFSMIWFRIALFGGIPLWTLMMRYGGALEGNLDPYVGGLHWQAGLYAFWESLFCVGMCMGLIVIFRRRYDTRGGMNGFFSGNAFGVYVFHPPILVLIALLLRNWLSYPILKFAVVSLFAVPACFFVSYTVRRIPVMRRIFS